jgi:hypothetical protein
LELHKAILRLGRLNRTHGLRLVTTNFDTFFEQAQDDLIFGRDLHSGPVLPIPRNDRIASWRSIAYLHCRLADNGESNDHLVLTSADFGRAYLTDAWAARFVARLFADFTVLFVGYRLNDPVLRYMTDAFAAEQRQVRLFVSPRPAYIFVGHTGRTPPPPRSYRDRGLEPIFYNAERRHLRLKQTLVAWAAARDDFFLSAKAIVEQSGPSRPQALDPSDANNLIWAVIGRPNDGGHGARTFASLHEIAPIEWLFEFERREAALLENWRQAERIAHENGEAVPQQPILSLQLLTPVAGEPDLMNLNSTAVEIVRWLTGHLASIEFVDWVIDKLNGGRRLHSHLRREIRKILTSQKRPAAGFATFWQIVTAEGPWNRSDSFNFAWATLVEQLPSSSQETWLHQEFSLCFAHIFIFQRRSVNNRVTRQGETWSQ